MGMGVPGEVDTGTVEILHTCNIPSLICLSVALFRRYLDVPVYLENDANCAAWQNIGLVRERDATV